MLHGLKFHFDNLYVSSPVQYGPILLWQVGDVGCDPGYIVKDHKQYCYEITCVVSGSGEISSNGHTYPIEKGQVYLNRPEEIHRISSGLSDPIRFFYLGFDFDQKRCDDTWRKIKESFDNAATPITADTAQIHGIFSRLFDEMITGDMISQKMVRYCVYQIILQFYRELSAKRAEHYMPGGDGDMDASRQLVYSILNYIDTNLFAIEHLEDIGRQVGYSYAYVSRLFSQVVGKSLRDYYNEKRFEKAVGFLSSGLHSTEIAHLLKYKSLHSFSKAFSNHFGMSPSEYREKLKVEDPLAIKPPDQLPKTQTDQTDGRDLL